MARVHNSDGREDRNVETIAADATLSIATLCTVACLTR